MPVMTWDDIYSVKVPEIDAQHKRLFDLVNAFAEAIGDTKAIEGMKKIVQGLLQYAEFHIQYEERLLERYRYPALETQRVAHQTFIQKATDLQDRFVAGKLLLGVEVTSFLKNWLVEHILSMDMKYMECLTSKAPLMAPLTSL
jgi:hemerythrin-like metal-binding protein